MLGTGAETRAKRGGRFAVCQIQAAAAGQQELAADGRHGVVDIDMHTGKRKGFSRHQAGGATANHGYGTGRHGIRKGGPECDSGKSYGSTKPPCPSVQLISL